MLNKRKYIGVPTQEEILEQYNDVLRLTNGIKTFKQVKDFAIKNPNFDIEVNCDSIYDYIKMPSGEYKLEFIEDVEDEDIETIRYEYKNIMVYFDIEDGIGEYSDCITVYSDEGRQFGDEKYYSYQNEIERVAAMGLLELNPNF